jgi:hypothetical protein
MLIIVKGKPRFGKTRSEVETNLRKEWGTAVLTSENIDKCRFLEKYTGATWHDSEVVEQAEEVKKLK